MNPNPFASLLHSRKFWLAVVDAVGSSVLLLVTRYLSPPDVELVKQLIVIIQPVIVAIIAAIAWEDTAAIRSKAAKA